MVKKGGDGERKDKVVQHIGKLGKGRCRPMSFWGRKQERAKEKRGKCEKTEDRGKTTGKFEKKSLKTQKERQKDTRGVSIYWRIVEE